MATFSIDHIDYIERNDLLAAQRPDSRGLPDLECAPLADVALLHVRGIAAFFRGDQPQTRSSLRQLVGDLLSGFQRTGTPLIYLLTCDGERTSLYWGTTDQDGALAALRHALAGSLPGIDLAPLGQEGWQQVTGQVQQLPYTAILTGTPSVAPPDTQAGIMLPAIEEARGLSQVDRLIRGLSGSSWAYLVVARPVGAQKAAGQYAAALNELRTITNARQSTGAEIPILAEYEELVKTLLDKLRIGKAQGLWDVTSILRTGSTDSLARGAALLQALFGGEHSRPDPVRVLTLQTNESVPGPLGFLTTPSPESPGHVKYPYKYAGLLSTPELAGMAHLPADERPGYTISAYARFDVAPHLTPEEETTGEGLVELGTVLDERQATAATYRINSERLNRHALIAGTTGSGKTNTVFHMLKQIHDQGTPFLVIEPAKTEYRTLLHEGSLGKELRVFTLGDEVTSPYRLNPFEIRPGVHVQTHIDYLKSVFNASFMMFAPMPYVLEQAIHAIYEDKGWDIASNENERGRHPLAQPTMTDLYNKIDELVDQLGYHERITSNVKAALQTRINSLRIGGKGFMLDTPVSIPIETLLQQPTVLELERIGDDDEKSFLIGLILLQLYEYYITQGMSGQAGLRHVTVVEEAHRLLKRVPQSMASEHANAAGKAVETFANILSEVRAYGEGFLIVEQIPAKLAPDVIKNTNLKMMHRIVAQDDVRLMGGAMNLDRENEGRVTALPVGAAVTYSDYDDRPILIQVPYAKVESQASSRTESDAAVKSAMAERREDRPTLGQSETPKRELLRIVEDDEFREIFARFTLSAALNTDTFIASFPNVVQVVNKLRRDNGRNEALLPEVLARAAEDYFERRGRRLQLSFNEVERLSGQLVDLLEPLVEQHQAGQSLHLNGTGEPAVQQWQDDYLEKMTCTHLPFAGCARVCKARPCLHRFNVEPLLDDERLRQNFVNALGNASGDEMWQRAGAVCKTVVRRTLTPEAPLEAKRTAALCYVVQMSETLPFLDMHLRDRLLSNMIDYLQDTTFERHTAGLAVEG